MHWQVGEAIEARHAHDSTSTSTRSPTTTAKAHWPAIRRRPSSSVDAPRPGLSTTSPSKRPPRHLDRCLATLDLQVDTRPGHPVRAPARPHRGAAGGIRPALPRGRVRRGRDSPADERPATSGRRGHHDGDRSGTPLGWATSTRPCRLFGDRPSTGDRRRPVADAGPAPLGLGGGAAVGSPTHGPPARLADRGLDMARATGDRRGAEAALLGGWALIDGIRHRFSTRWPGLTTTRRRRRTGTTRSATSTSPIQLACAAAQGDRAAALEHISTP